MKKILILTLFLASNTLVCWAAKDIRDEKTKPYEVKRVIKTVDGHNFLVPEDRPVEMIAGQYRPVDIDTYVAYKFGTLKEEVDSKFASVEERLFKCTGQSEKVLELEQQVKELTDNVEILTERLKKAEDRISASDKEVQEQPPVGVKG